jgi:two-component system sensor histidine kinase/response regulator
MIPNSRLLVVEDDPDGQEVVSVMLEHLGIPVDVAGTAMEAEALLFVAERQYNAVIIDLALPDKDGWELFNLIQAYPDTQNLPCIAVTAFHTSKLREQAIRAGFAAYFPKPIDATAFARRLEAIL